MCSPTPFTGTRHPAPSATTGPRPSSTGSACSRCSAATSRPTSSSEDAERRVVGGDAAEVGVGRRRAHAVEEDADLELPSLQVGAQDLDLVVVGDLDGTERLGV